MDIHRYIRLGDYIKLRDALHHGADPNSYDDETECYALHNACFRNNIPIIELLLSHGADVHIQDINGNTPLHYAAIVGLQAVQLLITHGANINMKTHYGFTACHVASLHDQIEVLTYLHLYGADFSSQTINGETPKSLAVSERLMYFFNEIEYPEIKEPEIL